MIGPDQPLPSVLSAQLLPWLRLPRRLRSASTARLAIPLEAAVLSCSSSNTDVHKLHVLKVL